MSDKMDQIRQKSAQDKKSSRKKILTQEYLTRSIQALLFIILTFTCCLIIFMLIYHHEGVAAVIGNLAMVLRPVIFGLIIAYVMNPVMRFFEKKLEPRLKKKIRSEKRLTKTNRVLSMIITFAILIGIIVLLVRLILPSVIESVQELIITLPPRMNAWMNALHQTTEKMGDAGTYIDNALDSLLNMIYSFDPQDVASMSQKILGGVLGGVYIILHLVIGLIIAVNVLGMKELLQAQSKKLLYALFRPRLVNVSLDIFRKADEVFSSFIIGKLIDSAIIGMICYVGVLIMGMPNPELIAVIIGVTNIIPFFGPIFGAIPACILVFLQEPIQALWLLIFIVILQQLDGNVIGPKILGSSTGIPSFWVLVAILLFGGLWGVPGMLLGTPLMALIQYILHRLFGVMLRKKGYEEETDSYRDLEKIDPETGEMVHKEE